ncbi:hypothetical protein BOTBODRAFT_91089, partial [Botryobasidium botryosum FD-172 SS1]
GVDPHSKKPTLKQEPFSQDGFLQRLARWVVVDDQSINVVEGAEFRDLLLFISTELEDTDIPHRTKLTQLIFERYNLEYNAIVKDLALGAFTLDNAFNNNTMLEHLELKLREVDIPFDRDGNRIRCFPHVVNIAVQAVLDAIPTCADSPLSFHRVGFPTHAIVFSADSEYADALRHDPMKLCRGLISSCRASGQRRLELRKVIEEGNRHGDFGAEGMRVLQLLTDSPTRWDSTYNMTDRAIESFILRPKQLELRQYILSEIEQAILQDIRQILSVPHATQQLLSAEKTPTLSVALPAYEVMIDTWKSFIDVFPELAPAIQAGLDKLNEYVQRSRKTKLYALAMVINPTIKFEWIEKHWSADEQAKAKEWLRNSVYMANTIRRSKSASAVSDVDSQPSISESLSGQHLQPTATSSKDVQVSNTRESDVIAVDSEIQKYIRDGVLEDDEDFSLLRFWQASARTYPILYNIALDVLPMQASAVPCERVFSSSKETCTPRRNQLSPVLLEALQMLKFIFKQERLNFTESWIATERE